MSLCHHLLLQLNGHSQIRLSVGFSFLCWLHWGYDFLLIMTSVNTFTFCVLVYIAYGRGLMHYSYNLPMPICYIPLYILFCAVIHMLYISIAHCLTQSLLCAPIHVHCYVLPALHILCILLAHIYMLLFVYFVYFLLHMLISSLYLLTSCLLS